MKHKIQLLFFFLLLFFACKKENPPELLTQTDRLEQAIAKLSTQAEQNFFTRNFITTHHPDILPSIATRDDRTDLIDSVYQHILFEHQALSIVPTLIQQYGYPVWNESDRLEDLEGSGEVALLTPFVRLDQNHISAYLMALPLGSGDWYFTMVDRLTLDSTLTLPNAGERPDLRFHIAAYLHFDQWLFGTKDLSFTDWLTEKGDLEIGEEWDVAIPRGCIRTVSICVKPCDVALSGGGDTRTDDCCNTWVTVTINVCSGHSYGYTDPFGGSSSIGGVIGSPGIFPGNGGGGSSGNNNDPLNNPNTLMDICAQYDDAISNEGTPQDLEALQQLGVSLDYLATNCGTIQVIFNSNLFDDSQITDMVAADQQYPGLLAQIAHRINHGAEVEMILKYVELIEQTDLSFKAFELLWLRIQQLKDQGVGINDLEENVLLLDPVAVSTLEEVLDDQALKEVNGVLFPETFQGLSLAVDLLHQDLVEQINTPNSPSLQNVLHSFYPQQAVGHPLTATQWTLIVVKQYFEVLRAHGLDHNELSSYQQLKYLTIASALAIKYSVVALQELPQQINQFLSEQLDHLPQTEEEWEALAYIIKDLIIDLGPEFIPIVSEFLAFKNTLMALHQGNYTDAGLEITSALLGIVPIGKVSKSILNVFKKVRDGFKALKVVRVLSNLFDGALTRLKGLFDQGWSSRWTNNRMELIDDLDEVAAQVSSRSEHIIDEVDDFDDIVEIPLIDMRTPNGWRLIDASDLANATRVTPSNVNHTYIGKGAIAENGMRLRGPGEGEMHDLVIQIQNGNQAAQNTEQLSHLLYQEIYDEATVFSGIDVQYGSGNGFDNVIVQADGVVIINEAKQLTDDVIRLNPPNPNTGLPSQMSDAWIEYVIGNMEPIPHLSNIAETIQIALDNGNLTKIVTVVDKSTGEIVITVLESY
ncbi:MAG: hypothetical protein AAF985_15755 [Bacteroidota bacterium]